MKLRVDYHPDEDDRVTVVTNGIAIDVIAHEDGSVYMETYSVKGGDEQVVVQHHSIDRYKERHPNFKLGLARR